MRHHNVAVDVRGIYDGFKGGIGEYTHEVVTGLIQRGHLNVTPFVSGITAIQQSNLYTSLNVPISTISVPNKILNTSLILTKKPRIDHILSPKPDIIFMPNMNITSVTSSTPLIVTVHDVSFDIYPEVFSQKMRWWHKAVNIPQLLHTAHHIIAVSHSTSQDIQDIYNIPKDKISVVYPGVSSVFHQQTLSVNHTNSLRTKYSLPSKYILYLGTLEPRKNIQSIILAFETIAQSHPGIDLVLAGQQGWLAKQLMEQVRKSNYASRIHCIGFVDTKDKVGLYQMAELFVYPSFYEGFGFPPLEAMSCGTPTITSNTSSLPEVVGEGAWKVSPFDYLELAESMNALISDQSLRSTFQTEGLKQSQKFRWETSLDQLEAVFLSTLSTLST